MKTYLITLSIINKKFILEKIIIFCNIFKKSFFKKITKISTINFNNKLVDFRQQRNKILIFYY